MSDKSVMKDGTLGVWFHLADMLEGYVVSVQVQDTYHGPVISDLCIGVPDRAFGPPQENLPWVTGWYFEPTEPGVPLPRVTAKALQNIRLEDIYAEIRKALPEPESIEDERWRDFVAALKDDDQLRQRRRRDPHFYANVSQLYLKAAEQRQRGVYDLMAEMAPELNLAAATLRDIVKEAKKLGYLEPSPFPGVAGGKLTDKGRRHLRIGEE